MAANVKNTESSKYQKALDCNDHILIDEFICKNRDQSGNLKKIQQLFLKKLKIEE